MQAITYVYIIAYSKCFRGFWWVTRLRIMPSSRLINNRIVAHIIDSGIGDYLWYSRAASIRTPSVSERRYEQMFSRSVLKSDWCTESVLLHLLQSRSFSFDGWRVRFDVPISSNNSISENDGNANNELLALLESVLREIFVLKLSINTGIFFFSMNVMKKKCWLRAANKKRGNVQLITRKQ